MTPTFEPGTDWLTGLATLQPDAARAARTRQQCRAVLQRRRRVADAAAREQHAARAGRRQATGPECAWRNALAGAVAILCLVYLISLIATAVSLQATIR